ncbi:MAG: hypothetical protein J7K46_12965 [Bacteroidales bacterium]|nr:hypothetical protein [Bacteroidales bacterium]
MRAKMQEAIELYDPVVFIGIYEPSVRLYLIQAPRVTPAIIGLTVVNHTNIYARPQGALANILEIIEDNRTK